MTLHYPPYLFAWGCEKWQDVTRFCCSPQTKSPAFWKKLDGLEGEGGVCCLVEHFPCISLVCICLVMERHPALVAVQQAHCIMKMHRPVDLI